MKKIAILACSDIIGGHEFQAAELARSIRKHCNVVVYVGTVEHKIFFNKFGVESEVVGFPLIAKGKLPIQIFYGLRIRESLAAQLRSYDQIIISAGTIEAGIACGMALFRMIDTFLYLPCFYDRTQTWGYIGHLYNKLISSLCFLFRGIITINKIQAKLIHSHTNIPTFVIRNRVRSVTPNGESGTTRFVYVGRLDRQKRIDELMIWLDVDQISIKEFLIIGEGPMRLELENLGHKLKNIKCIFLGWKDAEDQDRIIRRSDVLILNSVIEGEPLAIREARARGMFILARDINGVKGITSRNERFRTQYELIEKANSIQSGDFHTHAPPEECISIFESRRREESIFNFVQRYVT